jgi:hypothetical protein
LFFISANKNYFILIIIEQELMDLNAGGARKARKTTQRKRSKSPVRAVKKGPAKPKKVSIGLKGSKKGGIDLTPFLTSLLLLGSRMAFDKRNPSKAFSRLLRSAKKVKNASKDRKGRKGRRTYGGSAEELEQNILETFNNAESEPPAEPPGDGMEGGGRKGRAMKRKAPKTSRSKSPKTRRAASPKPRKPKSSAKGGAKKPKAKTPKAPKATKATKATKAPKAPKSPRRATPKSPRRK